MRLLHLSPSLTTMEMFVYYDTVILVFILALPIFADIYVANGQ